MSDYALNGTGIVAASIYWPWSGPWTGDVQVDSSDAITGQVRLELPGMTLVGTVMDGGVSYLRQHVRLVGGAGGLPKSVTGQHFYKASVRTIIQHTLSEAGEQLSAESDSSVLDTTLDHWQRLRGAAGRELSRLTERVGSAWSVQPDGTVRIGQPSWQEGSAEVDLIGEDMVGRSWTMVADGDVPVPGTTVAGKRIVSVEYRVTSTSLRCVLRW